MALSDNLVLKVKAETGQTVITDAINNIQWSGGAGSATLVDDATHGLLWRITGGQKTAAFATLGKYLDTTPKAITIAMQFRITNRAGYTKFLTVGADAANNHLAITNNGNATSALRCGVYQAGSVTTPHPLPPYTSGDVITLVFRVEETGTTSDLNDVWSKVHGGAVNHLTQVTNSIGSTARELVYAAIGTAAGETFDLLNLAVWLRGLSDEEAAAVDNDIRGQLWPSAGTDATAPATTVTGTSTINAGVATGGSGNVDATAPTTTVSGTSTINAGVATSGSTGSFTTDTFENNTHSAHPSGTVIYWEWRVGNIGQAPTSITYGPPGGTALGAGGTLALTGLPLGAGELWARDAADGRWCQPGTVT